MNIGIIGLGRMGLACATRFNVHGLSVFGFDINISNDKKIFANIKLVSSLRELCRIIDVLYILVPESSVDSILDEILIVGLKSDCIIVDSGNSYFLNSIKRYERLKEKDISFLDCGISGGVHGKDLGFSLMIGGDYDVFLKLIDVWKALTCEGDA